MKAHTSSYFGKPAGTTPPEQTRNEQRKREREREREHLAAKLEAHKQNADCMKCGAANDETHLLCSDCQHDHDA